MNGIVSFYTIRTREIPVDLLDSEFPLLVTRPSPRKVRLVVQDFAYYFRREFGYDFVQFAATERDNYKAYLFANPSNEWPRVWAGACCFRWRDYKDIGSCWSLQWAWLHPYLRRKGIFGAAWDKFRSEMGKFFTEPPYSDAMVAFLRKRGACVVCWRPLGRSKEIFCLRCQNKYNRSPRRRARKN
jgi:hypothetical protein